MEDSLQLFHPLIRRWFREKLGKPTRTQGQAWPVIAAGRHVLITAPTGSGKTLTAFLWALQQLIVGKWPTGETSVLYVSPLKALNNDIQRNLLEPLRELEGIFEEAGLTFPSINPLTRSGDTPAGERRRMLRRPPEILITTPESLNLILSSKQAQRTLSSLKTVIIDEIHSVAGSKRGTHLMTAVERAARLAGEFQRIALSATIKPLTPVAGFIGGRTVSWEAGHAEYREREVAIIDAAQNKEYEIHVRFAGEESGSKETRWSVLVDALKKSIRRNRSTLVFANNRRLCEKISLLINTEEDRPLAYAHHGSLSRETRLVVEERLKRGELSAIVATATLELGIDVGALDEVILLETPPTVSAGVQRIGRAGHRVNEVSRSEIFPVHARDFLNAAAMVDAILQRDIEEVRIVENPLDVLAQVIVSMTSMEPWEIDRLYDFLCACASYRNLNRRHYDLVLDMLAGRYAGARLRDMNPRISIDRVDGVVRARPGAVRLLYLSGGTIPDRGYFTLRRLGTNARIGELDEEFVWETTVGETFTLGNQAWQVQKITHNDVFVLPGSRGSRMPFWRSEEMDRDFHFSSRVGRFLEWADAELDRPDFTVALENKHRVEPSAAALIRRFLKRQREATGAALPHRHHLLIERTAHPEGIADTEQVIFHTQWGGKVNRPLGLLLTALWEQEHGGGRLDVFSGNDCIAMLLPKGCDAVRLLTSITGRDTDRLLRQALERSGFFGARFRENAARALLVTRDSFNRRMPLWMSRLRSKRLLDSVSRHKDFPVIIETWRTCLREEFDMDTLHALLGELRSGKIKTSDVTTTAPSPFAEELVFQQTNRYMYADDTPESQRLSSLSDEILRELVFSSETRPAVPARIIGPFQQKLQRVWPGYAPRAALEILEWVKERLLVPLREWEELRVAVERDSETTFENIVDSQARKLAIVYPPNASVPSVIAVENLPRLFKALEVEAGEVMIEPAVSDIAPAGAPGKDASTNGLFEKEDEPEEDLLAGWVAEWLRYYGPVRKEFVSEVHGLNAERSDVLIDALESMRAVAVGTISEGAVTPEICDTENLERLLRLMRAAARPEFRTLPLERLALFLGEWHGCTRKSGTIEDLQRTLEKLFGYPAPAESWETDLLPARLSPYNPSWLDTLIQESDLVWFGCGTKTIALAFADSLDLFAQEPGEQETMQQSPVPSPTGRYSFEELLDHTGKFPRDLSRDLWQGVWRGALTNDTFVTLRHGIEQDFRIHPVQREATGRSGSMRWRSRRPLAGHWYSLPTQPPPADALEADELGKERVRVLLDRYGVLFRELLDRELPQLRWSRVFRALRLMELSGEVVAGHFFDRIPGLQFVSNEALRRLEAPLQDDAVFWLNAADPAAVTGLGLDLDVPPRLTSTYVVYHGANLVLTAKRHGADLVFRTGPDNPDLPRYLGLFDDLLNRQFLPYTSIGIKTINGESAPQSPYIPAFRSRFRTTVNPSDVKLWRY